MTDRFTVGVVTTTHGVQGEVKVYPTTSDPGRFKKLKEVTVLTARGEEKLHVERVKFFKQFVIVKFEEYSSLNDVEHLRKAELTVTRDQAVPLDDNEFYVADLIGIRCETDTGEDLGILKDVMETGANDVYVIEHDGKEILIPAIRDCVLGIDVENRVMRIHVLEGLI